MNSTCQFPPLWIEPHDGPFRASLTDLGHGVSVSLTRRDPDGRRRLISIEVVDAPWHWVANLCHDRLARMNRPITSEATE